MQKITKTTLKSFVTKNINNLYIHKVTSFDGTIDGINKDGRFEKINPKNLDFSKTHSWGIGLFLSNTTPNFIEKINNGFEVSNCCGKFQLITN